MGKLILAAEILYLFISIYFMVREGNKLRKLRKQYFS